MKARPASIIVSDEPTVPTPMAVPLSPTGALKRWAERQRRLLPGTEGCRGGQPGGRVIGEGRCCWEEREPGRERVSGEGGREGEGCRGGRVLSGGEGAEEGEGYPGGRGLSEVGEGEVVRGQGRGMVAGS